MSSCASRSAILLATAFSLALPAPAVALELFGITIFKSRADRDEEAVIGDPQNYTVDFIVEGGDGDVEEAVKNASGLWRGRDDPASGAAGLIAKARGDYRALLGALYRQGRYGGVIAITIDGRDAARLEPDAVFPDPVAVSVRVTPGPVFTFSGAGVINPAPPPADEGDAVEAPSDKGYAPGEVARSTAVKDAAALSLEAWRQQGHAKARIADTSIVADHDTSTVDAALTVDPGPKAFYGMLAVEGTGRMDPEFVAWMAGLEPGAEYDPDDLARASKRLARLDVFTSQRFVEADAIGDDGILPVSLVVQERKPRRIGVGATFSTTDGLGVEGYWLHRNLFGKAERFRVEGKVAGIGRTSDVRDFDYRLAATFTRPGFITRDTDLSVTAEAEREVLPAYKRTAGGGEVRLSHLFSETLSGYGAVFGEYARYNDVFGTRDFTTAGARAGLVRDTRDSETDATKGFYLSAEAEPFHEFTYANTAVKAVGEARAYVAPGDGDRVVLAARIKAGMLAGMPIAEAPPDKLFFAGGGGSVRGFGYKSIGVDTPLGLVGGRSLFETSAEIRLKATDTIGVVAFADAGAVGPRATPDFSDMRFGAGLGLRYYTALGPLRLDAAIPLNRRPGDSSFAVYAGIGQAF